MRDKRVPVRGPRTASAWRAVFVRMPLLCLALLLCLAPPARAEIPNAGTYIAPVAYSGGAIVNLTMPRAGGGTETVPCIRGARNIRLRWTASNPGSFIHCREYIVYISKHPDSAGNPSGFVGLDFNAHMVVRYSVGAGFTGPLVPPTEPAPQIDLAGLPDGRYYYRVAAISEGRSHYYNTGWPTYHPAWYKPPVFPHPAPGWVGGVIVGGVNTAWNIRFYSVGAVLNQFVVDSNLDDASYRDNLGAAAPVAFIEKVWDGPVPYRDIQETNIKSSISATWSPYKEYGDPHGRWRYEDRGSGIDRYEYRILNVSTGVYQTAFISTGNGTDGRPRSGIYHTGITLVDGNTYRVEVRAIDRAGYVSAVTASDGVTYRETGVYADTRRNLYDILVDSTAGSAETVNPYYAYGEGKYYVMGRPMTSDSATLLAVPGLGSMPNGDARKIDYTAGGLLPSAPATKHINWDAGSVGGIGGSGPTGSPSPNFTYPYWHVQYFGPIKVGRFGVESGYIETPYFLDSNRPATLRIFPAPWAGYATFTAANARAWEGFYDAQEPTGEYYWSQKLIGTAAAGHWYSSPAWDAFRPDLNATVLAGAPLVATANPQFNLPNSGVYGNYWVRQETWFYNSLEGGTLNLEYASAHGCEIWLNSRRLLSHPSNPAPGLGAWFPTLRGVLDTSYGYKHTHNFTKKGWNHLLIFYPAYSGDDGFQLRRVGGGQPFAPAAASTNVLRPSAPFDVIFEAHIDSYGATSAKYATTWIKLDSPLTLKGVRWWESPPSNEERMIDRTYTPPQGACVQSTLVDRVRLGDPNYNAAFPVVKDGAALSDDNKVGPPDSIPATVGAGATFRVNFFIQNTGTMVWNQATTRVQALWFKNGTPAPLVIAGAATDKVVGTWKEGPPPYAATDIVYQKTPGNVDGEIYVPDAIEGEAAQSLENGNKVAVDLIAPSTPGFYLIKLNMWDSALAAPKGFGQPFAKFIQVLPAAKGFVDVAVHVADNPGPTPGGPDPPYGTLALGTPLRGTLTDLQYTREFFGDLYKFDYPGGVVPMNAKKWVRFQVTLTPYATYTADLNGYIAPSGGTTASAVPGILATPFFHALSFTYEYDAAPKIVAFYPTDTRWYAGHPYGIVVQAYNVDGHTALATCELTLYKDSKGLEPIRTVTIVKADVDPAIAKIDGDTEDRLVNAKNYTNSGRRFITSGNFKRYHFNLSPQFPFRDKYEKVYARVRVYHATFPKVYADYPVAASDPVALCTTFNKTLFRYYNPTFTNIEDAQFFARTYKTSKQEEHNITPDRTKPPHNLGYFSDADTQLNGIYFNGGVYFDAVDTTSTGLVLAPAKAREVHDATGKRIVWRLSLWKDFDDAARLKIYEDAARVPVEELEFDMLLMHYMRNDKPPDDIRLVTWSHGTDPWPSGLGTDNYINFDGTTNSFAKIETWFYHEGGNFKMFLGTDHSAFLKLNGELIHRIGRAAGYDPANPTHVPEELTMTAMRGWNHLSVYVADIQGKNDAVNGICYRFPTTFQASTTYHEPAPVRIFNYPLFCAHPIPQPNLGTGADFYNNQRGTVLSVMMDGAETKDHLGKPAVEAFHCGFFFADRDAIYKIVAGIPDQGGDHHFNLRLMVKKADNTSYQVSNTEDDPATGNKGRIIVHANHTPNIPGAVKEIHPEAPVYCLAPPYEGIEVIRELDPILRVVPHPDLDRDNPVASQNYHHSKYIQDWRTPFANPAVARTDEVKYMFVIDTNEITTSLSLVNTAQMVWVSPKDLADPRFDAFHPKELHATNPVLLEAHYQPDNTLAPIHYYRAWARDEHLEAHDEGSGTHRFIVDRTPPVVSDIHVFYDKQAVRLDQDVSELFPMTLTEPGTVSVAMHGHVLTLWAQCTDEICADPRKFKNGRFFVREHIDPSDGGYSNTALNPWKMVEATVESDLSIIGDDKKFQFNRRPKNHPDGLHWYAYYTVPYDAKIGWYDVDFQVTDPVGNTSLQLYERTDDVRFQKLVRRQFEVRTMMTEQMTCDPSTRIKSVKISWIGARDHRDNDTVDHYILSVGDIAPPPFNTNNWVDGAATSVTKEVTMEGLNPIFLSPVEKVETLGFGSDFVDFIFDFENVQGKPLNPIDGWREDTSELREERGALTSTVYKEGGFGWSTFAHGAAASTRYRLYKDYNIGHNKRLAFGAWVKLADAGQVAELRAICLDAGGNPVTEFASTVGQFGELEQAWVEAFLRNAEGKPYFVTPVGTVKVRLCLGFTHGSKAHFDKIGFASYGEVFVDLTPPLTPEPVFGLVDNHPNTGDQAIGWAWWDGVPDVRGSAWIDEPGNFPTLVVANQRNLRWSSENVKFGASAMLVQATSETMATTWFKDAEVKMYPRAGDKFSFFLRPNDFRTSGTSGTYIRQCVGLAFAFHDGFDWNGRAFFADPAEAGMRTALCNAQNAALAEIVADTRYHYAGELPRGDLWNLLELPFDGMDLAGREIAGMAVTAAFKYTTPNGHTGSDTVAVQLDYLGVAAGSGLAYYYPQIKVENVTLSARYTDFSMFNTIDPLTGASVNSAGWMQETEIFYDDAQMASDARATTAIRFTGERSVVVASSSADAIDYSGGRLTGVAQIRVSKPLVAAPAVPPKFHTAEGGAIVVHARPIEVDGNLDSLSELNIGVKWRKEGQTAESDSAMTVAKFRGAQLRPRSVLPPKFDELYPVGTSSVDLALTKAVRSAVTGGATLYGCSDILQTAIPSVIGIPPAVPYFDAAPMSKSSGAPSWDPYLIPVSRFVPAEVTGTIEVIEVRVEAANCAFAVDAIGPVRPFVNNADWIGDLSPAVFLQNAVPDVTFHNEYILTDPEVIVLPDGSTSELTVGYSLDSTESIRFSWDGGGLKEQVVEVRSDIANRDKHLMKIPAKGGLIACYIRLGEDAETWPDEIMLEFHTTSLAPGFFPHRAYWGQDLIARGDTARTNSPDHYEMGPIPFDEARNNWAALVIPTDLIGLNGYTVDAVRINVFKIDTEECEINFDRIGLAGTVNDCGTYKKHFAYTWAGPDYSFFMFRVKGWDNIKNDSAWGYAALAMSQDRTPPVLAAPMTSLVNYMESGITKSYGAVYRDNPNTGGGGSAVTFNYSSVEVALHGGDHPGYFPPMDLSVTTDATIDFRVVPYHSGYSERIYARASLETQFGERKDAYLEYASAYDPSPSIGYIVGEWQIDRIGAGTSDVELASAAEVMEGSAEVTLLDASTISLVVTWPAGTDLNALGIVPGDFVQLEIGGGWEKAAEYHAVREVLQNAGAWKEMRVARGSVASPGILGFRVYRGATNYSESNLWMVDPQKKFTNARYYFINGENYVATYYVYDSDRNFTGPYNCYVDVTPGDIAYFKFYQPSEALSKVEVRADMAKFDGAGKLIKDGAFWVGARAFDAVGNIVMRDKEVRWLWNGTFMNAEHSVYNYIDDYRTHVDPTLPRHENLPFDAWVRMTVTGVTGGAGGTDYGKDLAFTPTVDDPVRCLGVTLDNLRPDRLTLVPPPRPYFEIGYNASDERLLRQFLRIHRDILTLPVDQKQGPTDALAASFASLGYTTQEVFIQSLTGYNADGAPWKIVTGAGTPQTRRRTGTEDLASGDAEAYFLPSVRAGETFYVDIANDRGDIYARSPLITVTAGSLYDFKIKASPDQEEWEDTTEIRIAASDGYVWLKTEAFDASIRDRYNLKYFGTEKIDVGTDQERSVYYEQYKRGIKSFTFENVGTNEIIINPLWFMSEQRTAYPGFGGTLPGGVPVSSVDWTRRYHFDNTETMGVFLSETISSINKFNAGWALTKKDEYWGIFACATTEVADSLAKNASGDTYEVTMKPEPDALDDITFDANLMYEKMGYPQVTVSPQLKHYVDNAWPGGGSSAVALDYGKEYGVLVWKTVRLITLPPDEGYVGFREPRDEFGKDPGERRTDFNVTSFVDKSDFRLIYVQVFDKYHQLMDYEDSTEVDLVLETDDPDARIIPLAFFDFAPTGPGDENPARFTTLEVGIFQGMGDLRERFIRMETMTTAEASFYGRQNVRVLEKYHAGNTYELGVIKSQPTDDTFMMQCHSKLQQGRVPLLLSGRDARKKMTLRVFSRNPAYDDAKDQNPSSTATIHIHPNRLESVHFEPGIHRDNPPVKVVVGRTVDIRASGYDRNGNMLERLGYFAAGWSSNGGAMQVLDSSLATLSAAGGDAQMPVIAAAMQPKTSILMGRFDSTGVDPTAGTVEITLQIEYDFRHFGLEATTETTLMHTAKGWIDVESLGLFNFPCAYQELDIDKLDRSGFYELSFWVKGIRIADGGTDDNAQIRAGVAFLKPGSQEPLGNELYDLVLGDVKKFKTGKNEQRNGWVKVTVTFALDGTGVPASGIPGINDLKDATQVLLYVGTPGATAGSPTLSLLYDAVTIQRKR